MVREMIKAKSVDEFKILQYMKKYMNLEAFKLTPVEHSCESRKIVVIEAIDKSNKRIYFYIDGRTILYADSLEAIDILSIQEE